MKVLVINQYAGNKGDCAVAYFIIRELLKNNNFTQIIISTSSIKLWENSIFYHEPKVKFIHWGWDVSNFNPHNRYQWERRRFMMKAIMPLVAYFYSKRINLPRFILSLFTNTDYIRALKNVDFVISTGGHHLTTRFSKNLKNELFYDLIIASMFKRVICWSQTFGPFDFSSKLMRDCCIKILESSKLYCRDSESINAIKKLTTNCSITQTYESVMGLSDEVSSFVNPSKRKKIIGITIYNAEYRSEKEYNDYTDIMAKSIDRFVELGYKIQFFPHEKVGAVVDDRKTIDHIIQKSNKKNAISIEKEDKDTPEHLIDISKCAFFIGHKTHSIVFALTAGTPVIALSYHPKTKDFMNQYGLSEYVIKDEELSTELLCFSVNKLIENLDEVGEKIRQKNIHILEKVCNDFHSVI